MSETSPDARRAIRVEVLKVLRDWLSFLEHRATGPGLWATTPAWAVRLPSVLDGLWRDETMDDLSWMRSLKAAIVSVKRQNVSFQHQPDLTRLLDMVHGGQPPSKQPIDGEAFGP